MLLSVDWTKTLAGAKISSFHIRCAESCPGTGTKDSFFGDIMHADGNAQNGCEADQIRADVPIAEYAVICAPVCHDRIYIAECACPGRVRYEPVSRPGGVGTLIECFLDILGQNDGPAF